MCLPNTPPPSPSIHSPRPGCSKTRRCHGVQSAQLDAAMALADMAGATTGQHEASPPPHATQEAAARASRRTRRRWRPRG
ncbi:Os11g0166201 [Oryza sativa Japonica Group]|uniref:Os11g0166201 protein n=1 Tax=Oryza sativa subsp. japonica TaxID=39947 RepID=A0A0P0XZF1_ORYSJ|nr:hypothetical protein EE612_053703 [Oryza sativa]BAT12828.1 Os11g0166201 [Oryza sativa Japonica Group]